jgi:hypothetical protein
MGLSTPSFTAAAPATPTCTLSYFCSRAPSLFKDVAMESSMFVPLVRRIHHMVYKTVRTEYMTQMLEKINRMVAAKLLQLEKDITDRENEYTVYPNFYIYSMSIFELIVGRFGNMEKQKQLLIDHIAHQKRLNKRAEDAELEYVMNSNLR